MKKLTTVLLVLLLSLSAIFAAGSKESAGGTKELVVWVPTYQFGDGPSDQEFWDGKFDAFEAEHDVHITTEILSWTDYVTKIYTGLVTGDGPDVVYVTEVYDLIDAGLLLPLDPYFTEEEKDNYLFISQGAYNEDGQLCTLPMMYGNACVMYFNMDMLNAAGITELPTTWDEFFDVCLALKAANPSVWPFIQPWGASSGLSALLTSFWPYYFQAGGTVLDENGNVNLNNQAGLDTLNFILRCKELGIFDESITSMDDPAGKFVNGQTAIVVAGTGSSGNFTAKGVNWDVILGLEGPAGVATQFSGDSLAVAADTEYPEIAAELIKYMTSAEVMDDFHTQIYGMPSLTKDAQYKEPEPFQSMYENEADKMFIVPPIESSSSLQDVMMQNIQLMLLGQMTPEQVLSASMDYYNNQLVK